MRSLLEKLFVENWQRKLLSLFLAVIIWFMVNQSLITSRTISNIPIRIINIPTGKTVVDLQSNGVLAKRQTLTIVGNKTVLEEMNANDLEIVIDAQGQQGEWIASISRRNLTSLNPGIDISDGISRVSAASVFIRLTKLVTEKIPVFVVQPIGEAPKTYQFIDVWPYKLSLTVSGSEEVVKRLKAKGVRLTLDLSNITKAELDALSTRPGTSHSDEVSFFVPEQWKRVSIPLLSETPIEIDDPEAKNLRIDFTRVSLIPVNSKIPVSLYFPTETLSSFNPQSVALTTSSIVEKTKGLYLFNLPLYAKGVPPHFVRIVEQMIEMTVTVEPNNRNLLWSVEFINPRLLEDRYVSLMMSEVAEDEYKELLPLAREEHLRNRFRNYMNRFRLYKSNDERLNLDVQLEKGKVSIEEGTPASLSTTNFLHKE